MTQQWAFLQLYDSVLAIPRVSFDFATMDEEGFALAEEMCSEGLAHLMKLKTDILNAKHKLQTSDLQRGVLPQTEEREEGVCTETLSDKTKAAYLHQAINGNTAFRSIPAKDILPSEIKRQEEVKAYIGQEEVTVGGIQSTSADLPDDTYHLRDRIDELRESGYGSPSSRGTY